MTKILLQNHPNVRRYPVSGLHFFRSQMSQQIPLSAFISPLLCFLLIILTIVNGVSLFILLSLIGIMPEQNQGVKFLLQNNNTIMLFASQLLLFLLWLVLVYRILTLPKREQLRYYKMAKLDYLPQQKRSSLRLDLIRSYQNGLWCETLEYCPLSAPYSSQ